jgi:hypothetical protein
MRTFPAGRTTKAQEPKRAAREEVMFWRFIDALAAIAMAIAVLN